MKQDYIEFRTRNNFGGIIDNYFKFLKYNFKNYLNLYLRYNVISIILTLITSYFLVTGFMGLASRDFRFGMGTDEAQTTIILGIGAILLFLILFITSTINYSFSSAYITHYVETQGKQTSKVIWQKIKNNIGNIVLFIVIGIGIYIIYFIVAFILALIPIIGTLVQYGISFALSAMFGLCFMAIFVTNGSVGTIIGESFNFITSNFIKVILYGFVIGVLNLMLTFLIISIPGFLIGIYTYFSLESNIDLATSNFAKIIFTIGFALFILSFIFSQAISQLSFGVLYYNLHEEKHNSFLQSKVDLIGENE